MYKYDVGCIGGEGGGTLFVPKELLHTYIVSLNPGVADWIICLVDHLLNIPGV
jgi:hypothetical protein